MQLVKQAASIMQRPQAASELSRDAEAMPMLNDLEQHLKSARNIVLHNRQHWENSMIGEVFVCSVDGAKLVAATRPDTPGRRGQDRVVRPGPPRCTSLASE